MRRNIVYYVEKFTKDFGVVENLGTYIDKDKACEVARSKYESLSSKDKSKFIISVSKYVCEWNDSIDYRDERFICNIISYGDDE